MLKKFAFASLIAGVAMAPVSPVLADQPAATAAPAPDAALSSRFAAFFTQVLARHVPTGNVSAAVKSGLTPQLLAQIDSAFAGLGPFRRLQFVNQDSMQGYQRYHYSAVFEKGSQGVMFVVDSGGTIAGFFQDPNGGGGQ